MHVVLRTLFAFAVTAAPSAPEQALAAEPGTTGTPGTVRTLEALPGVTIRYYDVAGANLPGVIASVAERAPKDAVSNAANPSLTDWNVNVSFEQNVEDGKCKITAARARFTGSVLLPRLLNRQALTREEGKVWDQYLANLRYNAAAELWFVNDRIAQIERAILNSSCQMASRSAAAAAENIKGELIKSGRFNKKPPPKFRVPVRDPHDPRS